jgi:hypothetical protein
MHSLSQGPNLLSYAWASLREFRCKPAQYAAHSKVYQWCKMTCLHSSLEVLLLMHIAFSTCNANS